MRPENMPEGVIHLEHKYIKRNSLLVIAGLAIVTIGSLVTREGVERMFDNLSPNSTATGFSVITEAAVSDLVETIIGVTMAVAGTVGAGFAAKSPISHFLNRRRDAAIAPDDRMLGDLDHVNEVTLNANGLPSLVIKTGEEKDNGHKPLTVNRSLDDDSDSFGQEGQAIARVIGPPKRPPLATYPSPDSSHVALPIVLADHHTPRGNAPTPAAKSYTLVNPENALIEADLMAKYQPMDPEAKSHAASAATSESESESESNEINPTPLPIIAPTAKSSARVIQVRQTSESKHN